MNRQPQFGSATSCALDNDISNANWSSPQAAVTAAEVLPEFVLLRSRQSISLSSLASSSTFLWSSDALAMCCVIELSAR